MQRILLTGGCGFVGSHVALDLVRRGYAVTVLDNLSRRGSELVLERIQGCGIKFVRGDVRSPEDLVKLGQEFALLIHCCAEPAVLAGAQGQDARYLLDVNLQGSINCFEWARERRVPVIYISSSRVYPYDRLNACRYKETGTRFELVEGCLGVGTRGIQVEMPLQGVRSLYGATKLCAELVLQEYAVQYGLPSIIDRCGVIAGPWQLGKIDQGVFTYWLACHYFKKPLDYIGFGGQGKQVRDLLHAQDLADLIAAQVQCLIKDSSAYRGEVFNAGGSLHANLSLQEASGICAQLTGNRLEIGSVAETRPADVIWFMTDNGRTEQVFGWQPQHSALNILQDTYQWFRDNEAVCQKIFT